MASTKCWGLLQLELIPKPKVTNGGPVITHLSMIKSSCWIDPLDHSNMGMDQYLFIPFLGG